VHSQPPAPGHETKTTPSPRVAIYKYLSKSFTEEKEFVQHNFSSLDRANEFLSWLKVQSIPIISEAKIQEVEQKVGEGKEKKYIVRLSMEQHTQLLLPSTETVSRVPLTPTQIETEIVKLQDAIKNNKIDAIDKIMREMSADNQEALFRQFYSGTRVALLYHLIMESEGKKDTAYFIFISHCCSAALDQALYLPLTGGSVERLTTLHVATLYLKSESFQALMDKTSIEYIDQLLCIQSGTYLDTPFVEAAVRGRTDIFCALINKASPAALSKTLRLQLTFFGKLPALHAVAYHQLGTSFITLINKADKEVISSLLPIQDRHGDTGLHYAIRYQPSDAVSLLIERSTPEDLSKACSLSNIYGQNILDYILSYHPPQVVAALLNKISNGALISLLRRLDTPPQSLAMIVNYLGHEPSWQTDLLMWRLFLMRRLFLTVPNLVNALCKFWLAGKELPVEVIKKILPQIEFNPSATSEFKQIHDILQQELEQKEKKEAKQDSIVITLRSGETISMALDLRDYKELSRIAEKIWPTGLTSIADYRLIQKFFPNTVLSQAVYELYRSGLIFSGCCVGLITPEHIDTTLYQVIQEGDAIIKAVRENRSEEFLRQISDYNYRPADLRVKVDKTKITHKLVHLKNETVAYVYHKPGEKENKEKEDPEYTKKMPVTAFSKQCTTSVFGEHDINQPIVCFMFHRKKTIIKMMASQDIGTHARDWTGSEEDVEKYYERHKDIIFTDYDAFCKWVNENPTRLNELLVKVSRESLLAITIVTDTEEARALARSYQKSIHDRCKINLPIFFYDRALRKMRPYLKSEQDDDVFTKLNGLPFCSITRTRARHNTLMCRKAIDQYFSKNMKAEGQYCFSSLDAAKDFLDWIKAQPIHNKSKNVAIEIRETKQDGPKKVTEYTVQLSADQRLLLSHHFEEVGKLCSRSDDSQIRDLRDQLESLIRNNKIGELDKLMHTILEADLIRVLQLNDKSMHLLNVAGNSREPIFMVFLSHCSDSVFSQTCLLPDKFGGTILNFVGQRLPGEAFCRLIDRMGPSLIDQALIMSPEESMILYFIANCQPGYAFSALINKASAVVIEQLLKQSLGIAAFKCIAAKQKGIPFIDLINKVDSRVISQFLPQADTRGITGLYIVILSQPKDAVSRLIAIATPESLNAACLVLDEQDKNIFDTTFSNQPPEVMVELLTKIDDRSLAFLFESSDMGPQVISLIKNYLSKESRFPTQPLVTRLLKHLSTAQIADCYCQIWLSGRNLPQDVKLDFNELIRAQPEQADKIKEIQVALTQEHKEDLVQVKLHSGEMLFLPKDEKEYSAFAQTIWQKGISSLTELHTLRKNFPNTIISTVVNELYQAGLLFDGCAAPYDPPAFLPQPSMQLKIEPLFPVVDESVNKLRAAHDRAVEINRYITMLRADYKIDSSSTEKKTWMMYFQEKITAYSPEITYSAAIKMANLLSGQPAGLSESELLALRSGKLGDIVSALEREGLLPGEFIKQEKKAAIERRGLSGRR